MSGSQFSYEVVQNRSAGTSRTFARMTCADCSAHGEVTISGPHNPEFVVKAFRRIGWQADRFAPRLCRCPNCVNTKPKNDPDSELRKRVMNLIKPTDTANQPQPDMGVARTMEPDLEADLSSPMLPPLRPPAMPIHAQAKPDVERPLTPKERASVRVVLDKTFDDATGRYLDDYNDFRIAQECEVPRAAVTALREAAYGPLRGDPLTDEMRELIRLAQIKITDAHKVANEAQAALDKAVTRLHDIERKLGFRK